MAGLLESYGIKEVLPTFLQRNNNNGESLYQHFESRDKDKCQTMFTKTIM